MGRDSSDERDHKQYNGMTLTVGTEDETGETINVVVDVKDVLGLEDSGFPKLSAWLATSTAGTTVITTAPDGHVAIKTSGRGTLAHLLTDKVFLLTLDINGYADVQLTHTTGALTVYLVVLLPDGTLKISSAITFS